MVNMPLCIDGKLAIVAIGPSHDAYPLDELDGVFLDALPFVAHEPERAYSTCVREGDVLPIGFESPARLLVLDTPVIMLETGIPLLPRCVLFAVVIEARDSTPRTVSSRLTGLGVETGGEVVVFCQLSTVALQIIAGDTTSIDPQAQGFVTDELCHPYRFLDSGVLCFVACQLVLVDQHALDSPSFCLVYSVYHNKRCIASREMR